MGPRPNFFLIGAPRSGTTALHHDLAAHPEVFMSTPKEPHYFSTDIRREFEAYRGDQVDPMFGTEEKYLALFRDAGDAKVRGESSVYYFYSEDAARGIAAFDPNARLVLLLREPISFLRSLHGTLRLAGDEKERDFLRALELEPARRRGEHLPETVRFPGMLFYSRYAAYSRWLRMYREHIDSDRLLVLLFDELRADRAGTYRRVLEHLGVTPMDPPPRIESNAGVEPRFWWITKTLRRRGPMKQKSLVNRVLYRINTRPARRVDLRPEVKLALKQRFLPEVRELSALLDRDLVTLWGYGGLD